MLECRENRRVSKSCPAPELQWHAGSLPCSKREKETTQGNPPPLPLTPFPKGQKGTVPRNGGHRPKKRILQVPYAVYFFFNAGRILVLLELHSGIAGLRLQSVGGRSRVVFLQPRDWRLRVGMFPSRVLFGLHLWNLLLNVVMYEFMRFIGDVMLSVTCAANVPSPFVSVFPFPFVDDTSTARVEIHDCALDVARDCLLALAGMRKPRRDFIEDNTARGALGCVRCYGCAQLERGDRRMCHGKLEH